MKILMKLVLVVVILAALAVGALFFYVDAIAKTAIERGGTNALGVETTVTSTDVGIFDGTFRLGGLGVANPPGFDADRFLTLGDGDVTVSLESLREDTVRLPTLNLNDLDLSLERKSDGANYDVILANLKRFESTDPAKQRADGSAKKFVINEVVIRNINVAVDLIPLGGSATRVDVPIEEIRLENVGSDSDSGVLLAELMSIITKAVFASVLRFGGDLLPADFLQDLGGGLENLGALGADVVAKAQGQLQDVTGRLGAAAGGMQQGVDDAAKQAGDALNEVGKTAEGALDEAGKAAEGAIKGIGDLFGGKKDK